MPVPLESLIVGLVLAARTAEPAQSPEPAGEVVGEPLPSGAAKDLVLDTLAHPRMVTYQTLAL